MAALFVFVFVPVMRPFLTVLIGCVHFGHTYVNSGVGREFMSKMYGSGGFLESFHTLQFLHAFLICIFDVSVPFIAGDWGGGPKRKPTFRAKEGLPTAEDRDSILA